jgi:hypothetical protein
LRWLTGPFYFPLFYFTHNILVCIGPLVERTCWNSKTNKITKKTRHSHREKIKIKKKLRTIHALHFIVIRKIHRESRTECVNWATRITHTHKTLAHQQQRESVRSYFFSFGFFISPSRHVPRKGLGNDGRAKDATVTHTCLLGLVCQKTWCGRLL